jgi:hypothetical protein
MESPFDTSFWLGGSRQRTFTNVSSLDSDRNRLEHEHRAGKVAPSDAPAAVMSSSAVIISAVSQCLGPRSVDGGRRQLDAAGRDAGPAKLSAEDRETSRSVRVTIDALDKPAFLDQNRNRRFAISRVAHGGGTRLPWNSARVFRAAPCGERVANCRIKGVMK